MAFWGFQTEVSFTCKSFNSYKGIAKKENNTFTLNVRFRNNKIKFSCSFPLLLLPCVFQCLTLLSVLLVDKSFFLFKKAYAFAGEQTHRFMFQTNIIAIKINKFASFRIHHCDCSTPTASPYFFYKHGGMSSDERASQRHLIVLWPLDGASWVYWHVGIVMEHL